MARWDDEDYDDFDEETENRKRKEKMTVERNGDMVLAQGEYALVQDGSNGDVQYLVGPNKSSLADTDSPVYFDAHKSRFVKCSMREAIQACPAAVEGEYLVLKNPVKEDAESHPTKGKGSAVPLADGCKVNIPGPIKFALYPGQSAETVKGHQLRSNQYLIVRVYNEDEANANWKDAVIKSADGKSDKVATKVEELAIGKLIVIKGTDVSFYIPPTGIEVLKDENGEYVRSAVTLERLEYCILKDDEGDKRYVTGPAVVFPKPTEKFIIQNKQKAYQAIELNENMGLYIKVIADYKEGERNYKAGEELFITGNEQKIYFPRAEHSLIKYGDELIHYAVAIPEGEARYVLDKTNGKVELINGPKMFLADPRTQVIVRRVLDNKTIELWFPGNEEAIEVNQEFAEDVTNDLDYLCESAKSVYSTSVRGAMGSLTAEKGMARNKSFTKPRTVTLNTKYDGAVTIGVWTGYAVQVINKLGEREVVVGPKTRLLNYDESLEVVKMSTGKPKSTDRLFKTVYLRAKNNKVSDIIEAETSDLVKVYVKVSYTVNFEGEPEQWFNVENYVKFLTDNLRSIVRNTVKHYGIEEFNSDSINIIRNIVLGRSDEKADGQKDGRFFPDNGMRVVDVDILDVAIGDSSIDELLKDAQHEAVRTTLELKNQERKLELTREYEKVVQETAELKAKTEIQKNELRLIADAKSAEVETAKNKNDLAQQETIDEIVNARLARKAAELTLDIETDERRLEAKTKAFKEQFEAVDDKLIAAIQSLGDKQLATALAENLPQAEGSLGLLLEMNGIDGLRNMLKGTAVARGLDTFTGDKKVK